MIEEKETGMDHIRGNTIWSISSSESKWVNKLQKLAADHPDEVKIIAENEDGSVMAHVPDGWVKLSPKQTRTLSEEQKAAARERLTSVRNKSSLN